MVLTLYDRCVFGWQTLRPYRTVQCAIPFCVGAILVIALGDAEGRASARFAPTAKRRTFLLGKNFPPPNLPRKVLF